MDGRGQKRQNYMPNVVSQNIIQQALTDMKQELIHQINIQTQQIFNILLTNIRAKINQQLTILTQNYARLMDQLNFTQSLNQKMTVQVQNFHQENQQLRTQLEIINSKNYQYLQEMNISKNELYFQKNLTYQHQQQKVELKKKVILYHDKISEYQAEINRIFLLFEKEKERNQELQVLLKSLEQNLREINRKYDQKQQKCDQLSSSISHKNEKIKQLKLIIEQSDYLNTMSSKTRQKFNFRISQQNKSFQGNQVQHRQQQRIKLYQSGYPLSSQLLFQISGEQKNEVSKEQNVTKKLKNIATKKSNQINIQKQKTMLLKEPKIVKKTQILAKKQQTDYNEKGKLEIRKRLNTIFTDRVKYRVNFDIKMQGLKCKLDQKQKQCQKLTKLVHARNSDKNSSSFLKKSFQNSRTFSKKSSKDLKYPKKQQTSKRTNEKINKSASQNLSQSSQLSNSKIIQNFQSFQADQIQQKKQDQFQEFGMSPHKVRHHYLNSEIDLQEDISFKMLQKNLDQSAQLSVMEVRSKGNESILDCSLQLQAVQINLSSNICKMDQIKQPEENNSLNTPINFNKFSEELENFELKRDKQKILEKKTQQKLLGIQIKKLENRITDYQIIFRGEQKQIQLNNRVNTKECQIQTQIYKINQRLICNLQTPTATQLQIEHTIKYQIQMKVRKQAQTKNHLGIYRELSFQIRQTNQKQINHISLGQLFCFKGSKIQKSTVASNTYQTKLQIKNQQNFQIIFIPSIKNIKNNQAPLNRIQIRQSLSVDLQQQKQSQILLLEQVVQQESQKIQIKQAKSHKIAQNLELKTQMLSVDQNELGQNRQINSARTRSSSKQIIGYRCQKDQIFQINEQKESESSKSSPSHSYLEMKSQQQNRLQSSTLNNIIKDLDKGEIVINRKDDNNSFFQTPVNCKRDYQKYIENTAYTNTNSINGFELKEKNQQKVNGFSEYEQRIIASYFFDLKAYEQVNQINLNTQTDTKNVFDLPNSMFVFQSQKDQRKCKFILWKGKIIHINSLTNKVSFMEMSNLKQLKTRPSSSHLILGNSEFTFIGNKLIINQKNKIKKFKGEMPQGQWRISTLTTYKTEIDK